MADHEVRGDRAVYDIETEEPRGTGRRRPAADWGVSEELFDRMPTPRRRFRPAEPPSARRESHPRRFEPARDDEYAARDDAYAARDDEHPVGEREHAARDAERPARAARTARHEAVPAFERLDERRAE